MSQLAVKSAPVLPHAEEKRPIPYRNLAIGAAMNMFQGPYRLPLLLGYILTESVSSLGQPMEVLKTHVCCSRFS